MTAFEVKFFSFENQWGGGGNFVVCILKARSGTIPAFRLVVGLFSVPIIIMLFQHMQES